MLSTFHASWCTPLRGGAVRVRSKESVTPLGRRLKGRNTRCRKGSSSDHFLAASRAGRLLASREEACVDKMPPSPGKAAHDTVC
jgi:hypothetical protein